MTWYILDEQNQPVPVASALESLQWKEAHKERCAIGRTTLHHQGEEVQISTSFLGINHNFLDTDLPLLFETMVFASEEILRTLVEMSETEPRSILAQWVGAVDIQKRYPTYEEAVRGHRTMVQFVEVCLTKMARGG